MVDLEDPPGGAHGGGPPATGAGTIDQALPPPRSIGRCYFPPRAGPPRRTARSGPSGPAGGWPTRPGRRRCAMPAAVVAVPYDAVALGAVSAPSPSPGPAPGRPVKPGPDLDHDRDHIAGPARRRWRPAGPPPGGSVGRLSGVGVGPGDPGLLTRRAMEVLAAADRVVAPVTGAEPGRAESVVRDALPDVPITRLVFDMTPDGTPGDADAGQQRSDGAAARAASHLSAARALVPWLAAGEHVAFVTLGDPNIYSTFPSVVAALAILGVAVPVDTVPGITAFQDLAARSGTVLLDGTGSLSLVTALDGPSHVAEALRDPDRTIVVYKGGKHVPAIADMLADRGRLDGAVLGELLGLGGERVGPLSGAADRPASYLATVIVPPSAPVPATDRAGTLRAGPAARDRHRAGEESR
ncbi:MAG: precorrin-2 C(20)-methyltransferase [Acidimicrobiales bacterium]